MNLPYLNQIYRKLTLGFFHKRGFAFIGLKGVY